MSIMTVVEVSSLNIFCWNNLYKITILDTYANSIFDLILLMILLKMSSLFHVNNYAYKSIIFEQFLLKNNILIPLLK